MGHPEVGEVVKVYGEKVWLQERWAYLVDGMSQGSWEWVSEFDTSGYDATWDFERLRRQKLNGNAKRARIARYRGLTKYREQRLTREVPK